MHKPESVQKKKKKKKNEAHENSLGHCYKKYPLILFRKKNICHLGNFID